MQMIFTKYILGLNIQIWQTFYTSLQKKNLVQILRKTFSLYQFYSGNFPNRALFVASNIFSQLAMVAQVEIPQTQFVRGF